MSYCHLICCSGPMIAMALAGTDAIPRWRSLMGPTKVYKYVNQINLL